MAVAKSFLCRGSAHTKGPADGSPRVARKVHRVGESTKEHTQLLRELVSDRETGKRITFVPRQIEKLLTTVDHGVLPLEFDAEGQRSADKTRTAGAARAVAHL